MLRRLIKFSLFFGWLQQWLCQWPTRKNWTGPYILLSSHSLMFNSTALQAMGSCSGFHHEDSKATTIVRLNGTLINSLANHEENWGWREIIKICCNEHICAVEEQYDLLLVLFRRKRIRSYSLWNHWLTHCLWASERLEEEPFGSFYNGSWEAHAKWRRGNHSTGYSTPCHWIQQNNRAVTSKAWKQ